MKTSKRMLRESIPAGWGLELTRDAAEHGEDARVRELVPSKVLLVEDTKSKHIFWQMMKSLFSASRHEIGTDD